MSQVDAIYTRQSVDREDSISVESQVEFCKKEVIGQNIEIYTDKGYSGKNTERPAFQRLLNKHVIARTNVVRTWQSRKILM